MAGEELKWRQLSHHQLISQQGPHFSTCSKAKANYKSTNLRKMVANGISDVAIDSVYFEKTGLKKIRMIIGRAKRAPNWDVQSRFRVIYIYLFYTSYSYNSISRYA